MSILSQKHVYIFKISIKFFPTLYYFKKYLSIRGASFYIFLDTKSSLLEKRSNDKQIPFLKYSYIYFSVQNCLKLCNLRFESSGLEWLCSCLLSMGMKPCEMNYILPTLIIYERGITVFIKMIVRVSNQEEVSQGWCIHGETIKIPNVSL